MIKNVHKNMCPILDGYGVMGIFKFPYMPSCEQRLTEPAGGDVLNFVAYRLRKLQRATHAVHNRAAACVAAGGGIFENQI